MHPPDKKKGRRMPNETIPSISITTGRVVIPVIVDGDTKGSVSFNPEDAAFIKNLHAFYKIVLEKADEWEKDAPEIEKAILAIKADENGIPHTLDPVMKPLVDINIFMKVQIDNIFGAGTSENIFGEAIYRDPSTYIQLIEGVQNYVQPVRVQKVKRYKARRPTPRKRKKKN